MKFNIVDTDGEENSNIEIAEGKFAGIVIQYGVVSVEEQDNHLALNFDVNIIRGTVDPTDKAEFDTTVGNLLVQFLGEQSGMIGDDFDGEVINDDGISYIEESGD